MFSMYISHIIACTYHKLTWFLFGPPFVLQYIAQYFICNRALQTHTYERYMLSFNNDLYTYIIHAHTRFPTDSDIRILTRTIMCSEPYRDI